MVCLYALLLISFYTPCTPPTAPVSRSFGLRSSYEIAIFDTELKTQEQISSTAEPIQTLHVCGSSSPNRPPSPLINHGQRCRSISASRPRSSTPPTPVLPPWYVRQRIHLYSLHGGPLLPQRPRNRMPCRQLWIVPFQCLPHLRRPLLHGFLLLQRIDFTPSNVLW